MGTPRDRPVLGSFFAAVWLVYLGFPAGYMLASDHALWVKALYTVGVLVFAAIYVARFLFGDCRPRLHWLLLGASTALGVALAAPVGAENWTTPLLFAACMAAFDTNLRRGTMLVAGEVVLAGAVTYWTGQNPIQTGVSMGITTLSALACIGVGQLIRANRALIAAHEEIARLAVAEERLRFARDLHDLLGHSLSVIVLKAELASKMGVRAPDRAEREVADIERVARDALREVRDAVSGYRQPGLGQELESARETLRAAGVEVQLEQHAGPLPTPIETTLAWTVREATTNVIRHSRASHVAIILSRERDLVRLTIRDDGRGGEIVPGNGLRGVSERLDARGGSLEFRAAPGGGLVLDAGLPVTQSPAPETLPA
jgi:two-component system sensor histidine kinase DesK